MIFFTTKIRALYIIIFVLFYTNNYAQILKSVAPLMVLNDMESDLIFKFENYQLTKHPKPQIFFSANPNTTLEIEGKNPIILNDSMLKVRFNPNGTYYYKLTNEQELNIYITLMDERGNAIKIIHPFKLKVIYENFYSVKVDSGDIPSPINKNLYPLNMVARVTNYGNRTHFTHPSTKVFIKSAQSKATIKVDSFKVENDSLMRIFFKLDNSIETINKNSGNINYVYYVSIENDVDLRGSSYGAFNFEKSIVTCSTTEKYFPQNKGDTGKIYTFYFQKKLNQTLPKPYQFTLNAYVNDSLATLIKTKIFSIRADTQITYIVKKDSLIKDTLIKYTVVCKLDIDNRAIGGVYSLKFYNDSLGDIWLNNLFEIPRYVEENDIKCNYIYTFPGLKESIFFDCINQYIFKDSVDFVFYKNNIVTNDIQIYSKIFDTLSNYKVIKVKTNPSSVGIYDLKVITKNHGDYYFPQTVIVSDLHPYLLQMNEYIFDKGETRDSIGIGVGFGLFYQNYSGSIKNIKFYKNGLLSNKITYTPSTYGSIVSVSNDAETGWYDVQFDTILVGNPILQKNLLYVTGNYKITDVNPKEMVLQGKGENNFTVHFSNSHFTKATVIFFKFEFQEQTQDYTVLNDTTVVFKFTQNREITKAFCNFTVYNNIDGFVIDSIPIRIYETPIILSLSPNWGARDASVDIVVKSYLSNYTELGSIHGKAESFSRNYEDANDINFRERADIIDDTTLLVKIWISPKAKGTYDFYIQESNRFSGIVTYKKSLCFTVVPTGINENTIYKSIDIYPNPSEGKLHIDCEDVTDNISTIEIMDTKGAIVYQSNFKHELNLEEILTNKGLYLLILKGEKGVQVNKIFYK